MSKFLHSREAQQMLKPLIKMATKCGYTNNAVLTIQLPAGGTEITLIIAKPGEDDHKMKFNYDGVASKIERLCIENGSEDEKLFRRLLGEDVSGFDIIKTNREEFEAAVLPAIKYLFKNHHPHTTIIIDNSSAQLVEGIMGTGNIHERPEKTQTMVMGEEGDTEGTPGEV